MSKIKAWWEDMPNDTLVETAWERQMNVSGMESYEQAREKDTASSTGTGKKFIRKLLDRAALGISKVQSEIVSVSRIERTKKATLFVVPTETLALITLKPMIDRAYTAPEVERGALYQSVTNDIARAVETELNFRNWVASSKQAAEAYAKANGLTKIPKSQAEFLIQQNGASKASMVRWRKSFKELSEYEWTKQERYFCGDALISAVSRELPEYFEIHYPKVGSFSVKYLKMTDKFRTTFDEMSFHVASVQMVRKPMLAKPKRWTQVED